MIPGTKAGYMRAASFMTKASGRFKSSMNDLLDSGAKRIIIDLRGNKGGSLGELANVLGYFAPAAGTLYSSASRHAGYRKVFTTDGPGSFAGVKVVLLTDPDTVSRAEIFAATLREWGNAVIVGGTTAGNVAATRGFRLKSGAALRITVAKLQPPSGADLDGRGVEPDVKVAEATGGAAGGFTEYPPGLASFDPVIRKALSLP
jgi:carboxyl-terminal processing protease